jgi:hypothetical protein
MRVVAAALAVIATIVMLLAAVFLTGWLSGPVADQAPVHWILSAVVVLVISVLLAMLFLRLGHVRRSVQRGVRAQRDVRVQRGGR